MLIPKHDNMRKTRHERAYSAWLPRICCLSGRTDGVELAHIRKHTGLARKPPPWHILPLHHALHRAEHASPATFWDDVLPSIEPIVWAERLHDQFPTDRETAERILSEMHLNFANLTYVGKILMRAT